MHRPAQYFVLGDGQPAMGTCRVCRCDGPRRSGGQGLDRPQRDWDRRAVTGYVLKAPSDGESEVDPLGADCEEVPPSPGPAGPKVQTQDLEEVVLDKGLW